jgi:hypothetical protein
MVFQIKGRTRVRVFENGIDGDIWTEEGTWRKLSNEMLHYLFFSQIIIRVKGNKMNG